MKAGKLHTLWIVVGVQGGIPATVRAYHDKTAAQCSEQSLRKRMHPENDETGLFRVAVR